MRYFHPHHRHSRGKAHALLQQRESTGAKLISFALYWIPFVPALTRANGMTAFVMEAK